MQIQVETFTVHKRVPLTISRGTTAQTTNIWLRVEQDGIEGWGEASPFAVGSQSQTTERLLPQFQAIAPLLKGVIPSDRQKIEHLLCDVPLLSAVRTALDLALHDWLGNEWAYRCGSYGDLIAPALSRLL